jgi:hypothetical protein
MGAAVSSADTGALVQDRVKRNPTFESRNAKRVANAIRGLVKSATQLYRFTITELEDI